MKVMIVVFVFCSFWSCSPSNESGDGGNTSIDRLRFDVLHASDTLQKDTLLQIQLALQDWSYANQHEIEKIVSLDPYIGKLYLIRATSFAGFAAKRGIDTVIWEKQLQGHDIHFEHLLLPQ